MRNDIVNAIAAVLVALAAAGTAWADGEVELEAVADESSAARQAAARDYTDIRWVLRAPLSPSQSKRASFRARLD